MDSIQLISKNLLSFNKFIFFIIVCALQLYFSFWNYYFYYNENILFATYGEQISYEHILMLITNSKRYLWVTILSLPITIMIRVLYTTFAIATGGFFAEVKESFISYFNISLKAELAVLLMYFTKWVFTEFIWNIKTLNDLSLMPFSLFHYFSKSNLPLWSTASLSYINIWEILYILLISFFLSFYNHKPVLKNIVFTLSTYGIALLFWIIILTYIVITLT